MMGVSWLVAVELAHEAVAVGQELLEVIDEEAEQGGAEGAPLFDACRRLEGVGEPCGCADSKLHVLVVGRDGLPKGLRHVQVAEAGQQELSRDAGTESKALLKSTKQAKSCGGVRERLVGSLVP